MKLVNALQNILKDFSLPFDDNLLQSDLRPTKTKKKVAGLHRSYEGLKDYCNIRLIIGSCKNNASNFNNSKLYWRPHFFSRLTSNQTSCVYCGNFQKILVKFTNMIYNINALNDRVL